MMYAHCFILRSAACRTVLQTRTLAPREEAVQDPCVKHGKYHDTLQLCAGVRVCTLGLQCCRVPDGCVPCVPYSRPSPRRHVTVPAGFCYSRALLRTSLIMIEP